MIIIALLILALYGLGALAGIYSMNLDRMNATAWALWAGWVVALIAFVPLILKLGRARDAARRARREAVSTSSEAEDE